MRSRREARLFCKLDITKTFDNVNWDFLWLVLGTMAFGKKWIKWIQSCMTTTKFCSLIDGSPISLKEKLRQGGP